MRARACTLAAFAALITLVGCSDSKPPVDAPSSTFNPFATDIASGSTKSASPPATLAVGDCFNTDQFAPGLSIALRDVKLVACTDPHQHEVYAIESNDAPTASPFPGDAAIRAFADDACLADFEPALGAGYRESTLDFATINPDATSWKAGDRVVICTVHDADFVALTGSRLATTTTTPSVTTSTSTASLASESG
jgi:hypothetical protein